ncbi:MAG: hypothetical protein L3V56_03145 [Candidatus Magnetoovum sp. WYHC-5]|nr:hypothetical protein [Candidatus Magnetoovum sp. WYHC-5]
MYKWLKVKNPAIVPLKDIPVLTVPEMLEEVVDLIKNEGVRPLHFAGRKTHDNRKVTVTIVLADDVENSLLLSQVVFTADDCYDSLTPQAPIMHLFERELYEQAGIIPLGHPWPKGVRYEHDRVGDLGNFNEYPYLQSEGIRMHEVAVGPVHAGIIEPGSFRFLCYGEQVWHLEIQLGYQHRGVEGLFKTGSILNKSHLSESIAGDTVIGHAWAYAILAELLTDTEVTNRVQAIRAIALELERIAMHLVGLGGIAMDIGYLPGASVYGRLRTAVINTMLKICGSRFGRGLIRPGGVLFDIDTALNLEIVDVLDVLYRDIEKINELFFNMPSVLSRLEHTGTVSKETAKAIGLVGIMAKMSGLSVDSRISHPISIYANERLKPHVLDGGDVFARAKIRVLEIDQSMRLIRRWLGTEVKRNELYVKPGTVKSNHLAVSVVEGWRGEISHMVITGNQSSVLQYKVKDPSFNNWMGLALAVRDNGISDFPLCNKSFDLSYCGFDL